MSKPSTSSTLPVPSFPDSDRRERVLAACALIEPIFRHHAEARHIPGLAYGVVVDGELIFTHSFGVRNVATAAPVDADTVFRIASMTKSFAALEKLIRANTYKRFGILIEGTYWRVSESESQFDHVAQRRSRAADATSANTPDATPQPTPGQGMAHANGPKVASFARNAYQPVSDDEAKAFMDALRNGLAPPVVRVGDQEYQSDLAPLDSGIMIGGTQYGKL